MAYTPETHFNGFLPKDEYGKKYKFIQSGIEPLDSSFSDVRAIGSMVLQIMILVTVGIV